MHRRQQQKKLDDFWSGVNFCRSRRAMAIPAPPISGPLQLFVISRQITSTASPIRRRVHAKAVWNIIPRSRRCGKTVPSVCPALHPTLAPWGSARGRDPGSMWVVTHGAPEGAPANAPGEPGSRGLWRAPNSVHLILTRSSREGTFTGRRFLPRSSCEPPAPRRACPCSSIPRSAGAWGHQASQARQDASVPERVRGRSR